jgi:hypothetical protein
MCSIFLSCEGTCCLLCTFDNKATLFISSMEKVEIRKASDNMVVMTGVEDGRLLKLKGTSVHAQNSAYLSHHDEGTLPSSLLWHARFGHGKHSKQPFHDSTSSLGMGLLLGTPLMSHHTVLTILTTFHHYSPPFPYLLGF